MTSDGLSGDEELQELRHRFRNALQVMNSLVALHGKGIKDAAATQIFVDLRSRLAIIARIFTDLDEANGETVDLSAFLPRIAHSIANQHHHDGARTLCFELAKVDIGKTRAGLLAQILAELLRAAFRHVPSGADRREIDIRLSRDGEQLILTLAGMPNSLADAYVSPADQLSATIMQSLSTTLDAAFLPMVAGDTSVRLRVDL